MFICLLSVDLHLFHCDVLLRYTYNLAFCSGIVIENFVEKNVLAYIT